MVGKANEVFCPGRCGYCDERHQSEIDKITALEAERDLLKEQNKTLTFQLTRSIELMDKTTGLLLKLAGVA